MPRRLILDTDIGDDIDDTWALGYLLKSPEVDLRLVSASFGDTERLELRCKLLHKFLQACGRGDVSIAMGLPSWGAAAYAPLADQCPSFAQGAWLTGTDDHVQGGPNHTEQTFGDAVQAMVDLVRSSAEPVMLLCIGPAGTVAAALEAGLDPSKVDFVGMHGSVYMGYDGGRKAAEHNVRMDPGACRKVFQAPWASATLTPLDTCGAFRLDAGTYANLQQVSSKDAVIGSLLANDMAWWEVMSGGWSGREDGPPTRSSVLFDVVAAYMAVALVASVATEEHLESTSPDWVPPLLDRTMRIERLGIEVAADGMLTIIPGGRIGCAVEWCDFDLFVAHVVQRLISPAPPEHTRTS